jgi:hypothetical protein
MVNTTVSSQPVTRGPIFMQRGVPFLEPPAHTVPQGTFPALTPLSLTIMAVTSGVLVRKLVGF